MYKSKIQGATANVENPVIESNAPDSLKSYLSKFKLKAYVYDYDRGFLNDDLIGYNDVDLEQLREAV